MKIREGAYYRTRAGFVHGPLERSTIISCGWRAQGWSWTESGFYVAGAESEADLISEVYVSDTPPPSRLERYPAPPAVKETEAQLRDMMRDPRYWRTREPEFVKRVTEGFRALVGGDTQPYAMPETKTLRDELEEKAALTILSGYYANPNLGPSKDTFGDVWDAAKQFVEARKK
jgi:hypothetical protein